MKKNIYIICFKKNSAKLNGQHDNNTVFKYKLFHVDYIAGQNLNYYWYVNSKCLTGKCAQKQKEVCITSFLYKLTCIICLLNKKYQKEKIENKTKYKQAEYRTCARSCEKSTLVSSSSFEAIALWRTRIYCARSHVRE